MPLDIGLDLVGEDGAIDPTTLLWAAFQDEARVVLRSREEVDLGDALSGHRVAESSSCPAWFVDSAQLTMLFESSSTTRHATRRRRKPTT